MKLRSAHPQDAAPVADLWRRSIQTLCAPSYPPDEIALWISGKTPDTVSRLMLAEEMFMVAEIDSSLAGFCCASFSLGSFALYVSPDFVRRGAGARLLHAAEAVARFSGCRVMSFQSTLNAVAFYESMGYSRTTTAPVVLDNRPGWPVRKTL